jgi:ABC-type transporter Mla subunit MlaD
LQHVATPLVATCAGNAAAILSWLAAHLAAAKTYVAAGDAIVGAAARAKAIAGHLAKILHRDARHLVISAAMDLEAVSALLKPQLATRQHKELVTYLSIGNRRAKLGTKLRTTDV